MQARALALTAVSALFLAGPAAAATIYVGECVPDGTKLPTIQQAINAVSNPGVVKVCPGTYAEQIVIDNKSVTVSGLQNNGDSSAIRLVAPPGGLVQNTTSVFDGVSTYAAQVVVRNGASATVTNLIVDGTDNQVPGCGFGLVGIIVQNANATLTGNLVANHVQSAGLEGCQTGLGIYAQNADNNARTVTVSDNYVENFQKNGITGNGAGLTLNVSGNTVAGKGPTTGAAQNGVQVGFGATGSIVKNYVGGNVWAPLQPNDPGNAAAGILVYAAADVTVDSNVVQSTQYGIAIVGDTVNGLADGAVVTKNRVADTRVFDGIDICGANNANVEKNTVIGSDEAGIHIDSSCGVPSTGNVVKANTIRGGCAALLIGPGSSAASLGTNKVFDADLRQLDDSDVCPAAAQQAKAKKPRAGASMRARALR